MKVPIRLYYDVVTGQVLQMTGNFIDNWLIEYESIEEQISKYPSLVERTRESFNVLELEYGSYSQDFKESNGYRVNPETKTLEFSYPDPNEPIAPQPYQPPLSEQVAQLEVAQAATDTTLLELMESLLS